MNTHEAKQKALEAERRAKELRKELRQLSREVMYQHSPGDTLQLVERMRIVDRDAKEASEEAKAWRGVSYLIAWDKL